LGFGAVLGPIPSQLTFLLQDAMNSNIHRLLSVHTRITGVAVQPDGVEILAGYAG
jgi:hypothetical protein